MTLRKMFVFFIAVMFVLPIFVAAEDDFEDDEFGSYDEEDKVEPFDAEESAEKKEEKDKEQSDAAMRDLLGDEETKDNSADEDKKEEKKVEVKKEEKKPVEKKEPVQKGWKPVLLVKGGFTLLGSYKQYKDNSLSGGTASYESLFGSVDEGLLGTEFIGDHVIAKGTMNIRTDNPFISNGNNPLAKENLHTIQNGASNALYEIYGGIKFFDIFVKAGKMIPEYGLLDTNQNLGMGFTTPYLTRSLIAVEGFIPETDAGFALGYKGTFANAHTIFGGLMLGTGSNSSEFWNTDKTMGLYGRIGYKYKEYIQGAIGLQYKKDYYNDGTYSKKLSLFSLGVHAKISAGGFEMPLTFDYSSFGRVQVSDSIAKTKSATNILVSVAPGYAYSFDSDWADKVSLAVRFDLVDGVYRLGTTNYLDYDKYKSSGLIYRIGATANFFAKEIMGVRGFAGITFLVQPKMKTVGKTSTNAAEYDYGFTTLMLSAGAEM